VKNPTFIAFLFTMINLQLVWKEMKVEIVQQTNRRRGNRVASTNV